MKQHFKRYGWLYTVCVILVVWPLVLWRMQRVPPLDMKTVRGTAKWLDGEVERRYGKPLWEEFESLENRWEERNEELTGDVRFARLINIRLVPGELQEAPVLKPYLDAWTKPYEPYFDEWEKLSQQGIFYVPRVELWGKNDKESDSPPVGGEMANYLVIQSMVKIRRAQAQQAMAERDWEKAQDLLRSAAHIGDPVRATSPLGNLIDVACRAIIYSSYRGLLSAEPPPEVERSVLEDLVSLRQSDPHIDKVLRNIVNTDMFDYRIGSPDGRGHGEAAGMWALGSAVEGAVEKRGEYSSPTLRSFAERYHQRGSQVVGYPATFYLFRYGGLRWTSVPASVKWLRRVVDSEPSFFKPHGIPEELLDSLDRWTLAFVFTSGLEGIGYDYLQDPRIRSRVTATQGRLLEAAFAARIFRRERGRWPTDMKELAPDYIPSLVESASAENQATPFLPFRFACQEADVNLQDILWDQILPLDAIEANSETIRSGWRTQDQMIMDCLIASRDWLEQPIVPLAVAECLKAHPKLVEVVRIQMTGRAVPRSPDLLGQWMDLAPWKPLAPDYVRKVMDETKEFQQRPAKPPEAIRLTVSLRSPGQVFMIWSPGPDGEDDDGRIVYDPTNGTLSRGDIMVFPEGY